MSTNRFKQTLKSIVTAFADTIHFVSAAVARIFGLNDDDYPNTGVQPFEGEPTKQKHF